MVRKIRPLLLLAAFWMGALALAQGAPEAINVAYADLSARLGTSVNLQNSNWRWEQSTYSDASLGCPQPGQTYAQAQIVGYKFTITFNGIVYDYRVSGDNSIVVLCEQQGADAVPTPPPPGTDYSNALCPAPAAGEPPLMRSRVALQTQARTLLSPNRLRAEGTIQAAVVAEVPNNAVITVIGGPVCADDIVWWQIDFDGTTGWTAEGEGGAYYIEPLPPRSLPSRLPISAENAANLREVARLQGNLLPQMVFAPNGAEIAVPGGLGMDALLLYSIEALDAAPRIVAGPVDLAANSLSWVVNPQQILLGGANGGVYLWDLREDSALRERLYLQTHERDALVALRPDGARFASAGLNARTISPIDRANAVLVWNLDTLAQVAALESAAPVVGLGWSPDGARLFLLDARGSLAVYDAAGDAFSETVRAELGEARALAISPNGQFLAVAGGDGTVQLVDAFGLSVVARYTGHLSAANAVSFSPDSSLLLSGGDDGTLRLWNTQTDQNVAVLEANRQPVLEVQFSPEGSLIAGVVQDRTARFFAVAQN